MDKVKNSTGLSRTTINVIAALCFGFYFALLQFAYFFLLEVFLSSRSIPFFIALFFWLVGFLVGLNLKKHTLLPILIAVSIGSFYLATLLVNIFPYQYKVLPFIGLCISSSSLLAGYFFPYARERFPQVKYLFFHENNGFIVGILISSLAAVFTGKFFLKYAPIVGITPVLLLFAFERWWPQRTETEVEIDRETTASVFPFWIVGLHLGILQVAMFFTSQIFISATYVGYFMVVVAWMIGTVISLKINLRISFTKSLILSLVAYSTFFTLSSVCGSYTSMWPLLFLSAIAVALPAGLFFKENCDQVSGHSLFFHENNGFVFGFLITMFGFIKYGVHYLYIAPIVSAACVFLLDYLDRKKILIGLCVVAVFMLLTGNTAGSIVLGLFTVCCYLIRHLRAISKPRNIDNKDQNSALSPLFSRIALFIAGFNAMLLQYFITREFSNILAASEISILIVATAFFVSYSVGYGMSHAISIRTLRLAAIGMFFVHMAILIFSKSVAGILINAGYGLFVMVGLLFLAAFCSAPLYAVLLPQIIDLRGKNSLASAYSWDLMGALSGIVTMLYLSEYAPQLLWPVYFLLLAVLLAFLLSPSQLTIPVVILSFAAICVLYRYQTTLHRLAIEDYYHTRDYKNPTLLFSGNSFYHSIDVVDTYRDKNKTILDSRIAFINGVKYFSNSYDETGKFGKASYLGEFTYFLAELPAKYLSQILKRKLKILIMGAGSMYSLARVEPFSEKTTLVEIDKLMIESSKSTFADFNHYNTVKNYEIVIDDAKHFLATTKDRYDLIINDVSAPYYIGTALMHSTELYELAKSRLTEDGVFAESTQSGANPNNPSSQAMKILGGVASVFPRYCVIMDRAGPEATKGKGFVFASSNIRFSVQSLGSLMASDKIDKGVGIYNQPYAYFQLDRVVPYSLYNLETIFSSNLWRIKSQLELRSKGGSFSHSYKNSQLFQAIFRKIRSFVFL